MAVTNVTNSDYAAALKILQEGKITELLHDEESFFKMITSKFDKGIIAGKYITLPARDLLGHPAVKSVAYNGTFASRQKVNYQNISIPPKYLTAHVEMDRVELELAKAKDGGFVDLLNDELDCKNRAMAQQLSRQVFGRGDGVLGVVSSVTDNGSTGTITLRSDSTDQGCAYHFEFGDILKILDASNSYAKLTNLDGGTDERFKVTDVDYENGTITGYPVDSAGTAGNWQPGTALAAGDLLVRYDTTYTSSSTVLDTASEEMVGFDGIIDDTAAQTLWGISRTSVPQFKSQCRDLHGDLLTVYHVMDMAKRVMARGGRCNMLVVSFDTQLRLADIGLSMRSISEPKIDPILGVETPRLVVPHGGSIPIVASRYCQPNRAYFLDTRDWEFRGKEPEFVDDDGRMLRLQTASGGGYTNAVTGELFGIMAMICKAPLRQGKLYNFTNAE